MADATSETVQLFLKQVQDNVNIGQPSVLSKELCATFEAQGTPLSVTPSCIDKKLLQLPYDSFATIVYGMLYNKTMVSNYRDYFNVTEQ